MSVIEKDYLPQFAAEAVRDFEILKHLPERGHIYGSIAELIRSAAHIVLPMNGEIYRDKYKEFTQEECVSSGVMPHFVTTFEYPINKHYFADPDTELAESCEVPDATLVVALDHKLSSTYDRGVYTKEGIDIDTPYKRDPFTAMHLARFGKGFYGESNRELRWVLTSHYVSTLIPLYFRDVNGRQGTDLNLIDVFTRESAVKREYGETVSESEIADVQDVLSINLSGLDAVVQACHSLRVGATLEARKEKSYTRSRTFEKKGVGGFEYHVLKLPTGTVKETLGSRVGSDKDGPRYHFRRAHLRTLSAGTQTFVRSCFVGNKEKGVVEKEYNIPKAQA
jgi:hypothetical protein